MKPRFIIQLAAILGLSLILGTINWKLRAYITPHQVGKNNHLTFRIIEPEQLRHLEPSKILIVDARPQVFFQHSHILNAIHLSDEQWDQELGNLLDHWKLGQIIVVYCASNSCHQSEYIAGRLAHAGIPADHIYILNGGWEAWNKAPNEY